MLHGMEKDGFLKSYQEVVNGKVRKYYRASQSGKKALAGAHAKVGELVKEVYKSQGKRGK
jgi:DNA-binding PadR family transcriptional regulator